MELRFCVATVIASLYLTPGFAGAQALTAGTGDPNPRNPLAQTQAARGGPLSSAHGGPFQANAGPIQVNAVPMPAGSGSARGASSGRAHSLLDEPSTPAQVLLSGDKLSISATNASLSELIRSVAAKTGMQVEGNSRDERVFGVYGPGSPPDVLSALLYDSGYNVMMVGRTEDGAPRRLVLSPRSASVSQTSAAPASHNEDDDDEVPVEALPPQPPPPQQAAPAAPAAPAAGQPRTPQQMLQELQRLQQNPQPSGLNQQPQQQP